jgi:hypothetical protein
VEVLLTLLVLGALGVRWLQGRPLRLDPAPEPRQVARPSPPLAGQLAPVLVVLPAVAETTSLTDFPWDRMWLNAAEQEIGPLRTASADTLSRIDMDPCEWVIIPRHAASQVDPAQAQFVRTWVEDGGVLLLEQPEGPWQALVGHTLTGVRRMDTRRITAFDGAVVRGSLRDDLITMPLRSSLMVWAPTDLARGRDYEVVMEVDGQPAVLQRTIGRGKVFVVLFDAGQALGVMQQGLPEEDLTLRSTDTTLPPGMGATISLVSHAGLRTARVPYADLLERNLFYLLDQERPVGRLWLHPGRHRGALLVGHSEAGFGDRAEFMARWEHEAGHRSTTWAVAGSLTPESLARFGRWGSDVQLQWVHSRLPFAPVARWGVGRFRPFSRPMLLVEQVRQMDQDLIPYGPVRITRALDGLWPTAWLDGFRQLDAAGVAMDVSYGPAPPSLSGGEPTIGYLHGTGWPFRPVDANGFRFAVRELPLHVLDLAEGYSIEALRRLINGSADGHHTIIACDWRPDTMATRPSFDALQGWRGVFDLARSQELWVATYQDMLSFLQRREASRVRSRWLREQRALHMDVQLIGVDGDADTSPSLAFAARHDGRPVERITINGAEQDLSTLSMTGDRVLMLFPLPPGEHRVEVWYQPPGEQGSQPLPLR